MERFDNKTVLITGGSTGIGAAFARAFAERGATLVLVARGKANLEALASSLRTTVHPIAMDLGAPGAAARVKDAVRALGLSIDVLVNNAGFATYGPFVEQSLVEQRAEIDLNVGALVELTHTFLPEIEARRGGVLQVASTAAFQPVPFMAVYGATKAFVLSFSEALWAEYRPRGVRVLAVCPGATDTPFFERAGQEAALGAKAPPEEVVRLALAAFEANRSHVITGTGNYFSAQLPRLLPRQAAARFVASLMRPKVSPRLPVDAKRAS